MGIEELTSALAWFKQYLSFRCDYWFRGKLHICCLQYGVFLEDVLLGLVVAKGLESNKKKKKESYFPTTKHEPNKQSE